MNFLNQHRITNPETLDKVFIEQKLKQGTHLIVQFSEPSYDDQLLSEINELCLRYDELFGVRFFSHLANGFDCRFLLSIENVKTLYLDCLLKADLFSPQMNLDSIPLIPIQ